MMQEKKGVFFDLYGTLSYRDGVMKVASLGELVGLLL
jgi:hypothetical protein